MDNAQKLTKAEKRELRKIEWQKEAEIAQKMQQYKKFGIWAGVVGIVIVAIFGLAMIVNSPSNTAGTSLKAPAPSEKDLYTKGNSKSKVVLTEYGDFQCPACASYFPIVNALVEKYKEKVYFVYRDFPLINAHKYAHLSARAAFGANKQNKYWEMYDLLYENQAEWAQSTNGEEIFTGYAKKLGMDTDKFKNDLNSDEAKKFVDEALSNANSIGINSTPSFFINGSKIDNPNSFDDFKKLIDDELNKK